VLSFRSWRPVGSTGQCPFHRRLVRRLRPPSPDASTPDAQPAPAWSECFAEPPPSQQATPFATLPDVAAEKLPIEDPAALDRALDRVACGEVVHLLRDGRPVADLVPAGADCSAPQARQVAREITQRMAERFGAPTLAHYRRVYESCGQPWPGDEEIRRQFPVADAS
jgi:antitoxin (DNA-binding transcriptional repressor) of toxin-antitoxin stability system